jgi:hypothetical protein
VTFVSVLLVVGLGADVPSSRDAGAPPWLPRTKHVEVSDQAAYGLARSGESYTYETPHFQAQVARDGVVSFKDKHGGASVAFPFFPFIGNAPRPRGPTLESTLRGYFDKRRRPDPEPPYQPEPLSRRLEQNEVCPRSSPCYWESLPVSIVVQGSFDLTDEIMRKLGQDPYGLEKAQFLSATFDFRIKLAMEARKDDLNQGFEHLPGRLDELWGDDRYSPRERRRILYELWYETESSPDGERAATIMRAFVRRRLPCGTPDGFTRAELETFARAHPDRLLLPPDECR